MLGHSEDFTGFFCCHHFDFKHSGPLRLECLCEREKKTLRIRAQAKCFIRSGSEVQAREHLGPFITKLNQLHERLIMTRLEVFSYPTNKKRAF